MTEHEWAERFNIEVDALLEAGEASKADATPDSYQQNLELAQRLARTDFSAESHMRQSLRRQLMNQVDSRDVWKLQPAQGTNTMNRTTPFAARRNFAFVAVALVLIAAVALTTPGRTLADGILRRIGAITLSNEPTTIQEIAGQPLPTPDPSLPTPTPLVVSMFTLEEASAVAGFPVYEVGDLPAGYNLMGRWANTLDNGVVNVRTEYQLFTDDTFHFLSLSQDRYPADLPDELLQQEIGDAPVSDVKVRGQAGLWVEQAPLLGQGDEGGKIQPLGVNLLLWEEDGTQFTLRSDTLSQTEMLHIAESLTP